MLSNLSPYSAQGLTTSFPGLTAGFSPMSPTPFGQPGPLGGNAAFSQDASMLGPYGQGLFSPNGVGQNPFGQGQINPGAFGQGVFGQGAFGQQSPLGQGAPQIIATLAQLAQHISAHSVAAQQISLVLHQVVQHLALQHLQRLGGVAPGLQQGGYVGFNPQLYAGFNPQVQAWGVNRPYTIQ
jgi:hypothetical protein